MVKFDAAEAEIFRLIIPEMGQAQKILDPPHFALVDLLIIEVVSTTMVRSTQGVPRSI